ncbi:MAG: NADH:flavin oxidoreductase [bacterium]|nr:NADH:flavin oxidoreductase [bacterium]
MKQHGTNPTTRNGKYSHAFNPCKIGNVKVRNRIVFPAWMLNYANSDGTVSEKLLKYYTDLAKGGCGMIITGCAVPRGDGIPFNGVMRVDSDDYVPGLKKLFSNIKENGAVPAIQLVHYGRQASTSVSGDTLAAPSAIPCPVMSQYDPEYKVKEMTLAEIEQLVEDFITAAERVVKAGAEMVEIHATHGYLINEFLSPYSNKRTDRYGGSTKNRARLIVEIVEGIRSRLKDDYKFAVSVRVNGHEFVEGGLQPHHYETIVPLLEKAGIDLLNVSAGVYESMDRIVPPKKLGQLPHVDMIAEIKQFATVPVVTVGSIMSLEAADSIIADGKADFCAIGRAQNADPYLVKKSAEGRETEIRECIHCNNCTFWTTGDPYVCCSVNPDYKKRRKERKGSH